ncbi:hypothetical protein IP81_14755, partial [Novosphingobium sp. AAP83]
GTLPSTAKAVAITVTNVNDDASVSIAAISASKAEGQNGITKYTFAVTRTGDNSTAQTVKWAVTGSGANSASAADFIGAVLPTGTISFAVGESHKTISINVAGDTSVENDEGFKVTLSHASKGLELGTASAMGTILNDDIAVAAGTKGNDKLTGTSADDTLNGLAGNDLLDGGSGNDLLDGGAGADTMIGGTGDDLYIVDNVRDRVIESANAGNDTIRTTLLAYTLSQHVENLTFTGTKGFSGTGNNLNNAITGGSGNDVLRGAGGDDVLTGGSGADRLFGDDGNDRLIGGDGNDILNGGAGADLLIGDGGSDIYQFNAAISEIGINAGARDIISDFTRGQDRIDLTLIDANTVLRGNQAFSFIGSANFTAPGQLRYANGLLQGNVNKDLAADFVIELQNGPASLQAVDILL